MAQSDTVEQVMVTPVDLIKNEFPNLYTPFLRMSLRAFAALAHPKPMPRPQAEEDPAYRQHIVYQVFVDASAHKVYTTYRKGGDPRLKGQYSIGVGGHVSPQDGKETDVINERWRSALIREVREELVDPPYAPPKGLMPSGVICSNLSPVDKAHLGLVYIGLTDSSAFAPAVRETDKLSAQWMDIKDLKALSRQGQLESWSRVVLQHILKTLA